MFGRRNMTPPMFDGSEDPSFSCGGVPVWSTWIYLLQKLGSSDGVVQVYLMFLLLTGYLSYTNSCSIASCHTQPTRCRPSMF